MDVINRRLKEDGIKASILEKGPSLYIRATVPARDGSGKKQHKLKLPTDDLRAADTRARELGEMLKEGTFCWEWWDGPTTSGPITLGDFRSAARGLYEATNKNESAWGKKWRPALNKLPPVDAIPVSEDLLVAIIKSMDPSSAARRDQGNILAKVAKAAGLNPEPLREASKGYSVEELGERDIPSDTEIEEHFTKIKLPHWRWMYGICATYGIRPHEIVKGHFYKDTFFELGQKGKTGWRIIPACQARWVEEFNLHDIHMPTQPAAAVGHAANQALRREGRGSMPFTLYDLRHAYAGRLYEREVNLRDAAKWMGHSETIHEKTYQRWYDRRSVAAVSDKYNL